MNVALIIPPLVSRSNDVLGSGIFYMPISMAYLAGALRADGHDVHVHDLFAMAPTRLTYDGPMVRQGMPIDRFLKQSLLNADIAFVFSWGATSFQPLIELTQGIKAKRPGVPVVIVENAQAVFALALSKVARALLEAGADYVILGECEERARALVSYLEGTGPLPDDGVCHRSLRFGNVMNPAIAHIENLDALPFPAWDLFPVKTYWQLGYAHGPQEGRYLALQTSRGCTNTCRFCVLPATNNRHWRGRSPENVLAEMKHWHETMGVREFHIEDVNPTLDGDRLARLGDLIKQQGLPFIWKFASGTKLETLSAQSLRAMVAGGCRYVSFSPESGSNRVLTLMDKRFDHAHGLTMTREMRRLGVVSQAVFILGFPGEEDADRMATLRYMKDLIKAGLDEVLVLITSPIPGAAIVEEGIMPAHAEVGEISFAPAWREDYAMLCRWQRRLYRTFFVHKVIYQPLRCVRHTWNFMRRRFETKMEMTLWRLLIMKKNKLCGSDF